MQAVVTAATKAGASVGQAGTRTLRAGKAAGQRLRRTGPKGAKKVGNGLRRARRGSSRVAGGVGRGGAKGARGASAGGGGAAGKGGLPGLDRGGAGKGGGRGKGGWAQQALARAAGRGRGGGGVGVPGGTGAESAEAAEGGGAGADAAGAAGAAVREWLRRRLRRRRGPLKKTRRRVNRLVVVLLAALLMLPFLAGMYGAEASSEAKEAALLLAAQQPMRGCPAAPQAIAERIAERLPDDMHIPVEAIAAYCSAASRYEKVDWTILAAIGKQECDHGRSRDPGCPRDTVNHCGARGPMQFLGNVWRSGTDPVQVGDCPGIERFTGDPIGPPIPDGQEGAGYATDGDGNNVADPWAWMDATHAAARYLLRNDFEQDQSKAIRAYNDSQPYIDAVLRAASQYRSATAGLGGSSTFSGACPHVGQTGGSDPIPDTHITEATRTMANAIIQCFGRGRHGIGCYSDRSWNGSKYEHPRGRACDFMISSGAAQGDERARGQAMAEWVAAHAAELHILYIIWYDRSWKPSDGNIPWDRWRNYNCGDCAGATALHLDHVHVSVKLMPGDPNWARCVPGIACSE